MLAVGSSRLSAVVLQKCPQTAASTNPPRLPAQSLPSFLTHARHPYLIFCYCSLDTGRLNPETYQLFDAVEKHYGIRIEYTFPDAQETMELVRTKGMFSFYEDGHQECCRVRKVSRSYTECWQGH